MNKVFKVIWNHATQTWTAVSELGHAKGKTKSKKIVKLTALAGAVILIALYLLTFLFSLMDSDLAHGLFGASFACTFIIPVVSYACILLYRLSHKDDSEK